MPISTTLQRLVDAKNNIASAIVSMGGSVGVNDGLEAFPSAIDAIPSGGGGVEVSEEDLEMLENIIANGYGSSSSISFEVVKIRNYCFESKGNIVEANFPNCTTIGSNAFYRCSSLQSANFPVCTSIGNWAFYYCSSLQSANFPVCTSIGNRAFYYCSSLQQVSFPNCSTIVNEAFNNCTKLQSTNFPNCTTIGNQAFCSCKSLQSVSFPVCTTIGNQAFWGCLKLQSASFPVCTSIGGSAFGLCSSLSALYLLTSSVCILSNSNAFVNTPISKSTYLGYFGSIYVPSSLVSSYKTRTNWTYYSDRITAYMG